MSSRPRRGKSSQRRRRGNSTRRQSRIRSIASSKPNLGASAKDYAQEVKQELERLFALGQGFAPQYDPAVEVSYVDDSSHDHPVPDLSVKIGMRTLDGHINEFAMLGLSHDMHVPVRRNASMVRRLGNLLDANSMYVAWLSASPTLTGSQVMERLLQFARCFNYRRVTLDDQSMLDRNLQRTYRKCSIPLSAYLLLARGERWYSRFGFELMFPEEKDKEEAVIREIREIHLAELELPEDSTRPTATDILGFSPGSPMKLGELFDILGGGHLDERGICFVESIFRTKRIHEILKTLPAKMELVLPSWIAQACLGRVPSAVLPLRTRRLLSSGVPPTRS